MKRAALLLPWIVFGCTGNPAAPLSPNESAAVTAGRDATLQQKQLDKIDTSIESLIKVLTTQQAIATAGRDASVEQSLVKAVAELNATVTGLKVATSQPATAVAPGGTAMANPNQQTGFFNVVIETVKNSGPEGGAGATGAGIGIWLLIRHLLKSKKASVAVLKGVRAALDSLTEKGADDHAKIVEDSLTKVAALDGVPDPVQTMERLFKPRSNRVFSGARGPPGP